jgi:hypothetical protein
VAKPDGRRPSRLRQSFSSEHDDIDPVPMRLPTRSPVTFPAPMGSADAEEALSLDDESDDPRTDRREGDNMSHKQRSRVRINSDQTETPNGSRNSSGSGSGSSPNQPTIARAKVDSTLAVLPAEAFKRLTHKFPKASAHIVQGDQ